jgi:hypothetical protein
MDPGIHPMTDQERQRDRPRHTTTVVINGPYFVLCTRAARFATCGDGYEQMADRLTADGPGRRGHP